MRGAGADLSLAPRAGGGSILTLGVLCFLLSSAAVAAEPGAGEGWLDRLVRSRATAALERTLGASLRVGRIETAPLSLEVSLEGLELEIPAAGAEPLRLRARRVRLRWAWEDLLAATGGRLHLRELELDRPEVVVDDRFVAAWAARPRRGRPVELRVDRLSAREGRLRYEDLDQPMDFEATGLEVVSDWDLYRHALVGRFSMEAAFRQAPLFRPLPLRVHGGFALERRRLDLVAVRAAGPALAFELDGHATWGGGVSFQARGRATATAQRLAGWLEPSFPQIEGSLSGHFTVERFPGLPLVLRGHWQADGVRFGPFRAARAEADVVKRGPHLDLEHLRADAYGGTVEARVGVALGRSPRFRVRADGEGLDLERLLDLVGRPLPFAAEARLSLDLEGEAQRRGSWTGSGTIACEAAPDGRRLALAGSGRLAFSGGRFRLEAPSVQLAGATVQLEVGLDLGATRLRGDIALAGRTSDAAGTHAAFLRILEALDVEPGDVVRAPLEGAGEFEAKVGVGGALDATLGLRLERGGWAGESFDRADVDLAIREDELDIRALQAERGPSRIEGRLRLLVGSAPRLLALDAAASELPLGRVLARLGLELDASGMLTGSLDLRREGGGELRGGGGLRVAPGSFLGEPFERAEARIEARDGRFLFEDVVVEGPSLEARGRATVTPERGTADIAVVRAVARLGFLQRLQGAGLHIAGEAELEGNVHVVGAGGPAGRLAVRARGVGLAAGPVRLEPPHDEVVSGEVAIGPEGVQLELGSGADAAWALSGSLRWDEGLPFDGDVVVRVAEAEVAWGRTARLRARLSGRARVTGPIGRPSELALSGTLERVEVGLGPHRVASSGPIPLALDSRAVRVGPGVLVGEEARIEGFVAYGPSGIELDARGRADLGILLSSWPDIRGSGPAAIELRARGDADSPDVSGAIRLEGARIRRLGLPDALEHVDLEARFEGDRLELTRFDALLGGGEISGSGRAVLAGFGLASYRADLAVRDAVVRWPEGFRGVYRGNLVLEGDRAAASVRGGLDMVEGVYSQEFEWGRLLAVQRQAPARAGAPEVPLKVLLDVDLAAGGNVWVRNTTAQIESRLDLHIGGRLDRPELTGRIWLYEGGTVRFRDVEYRVVSGTLDFTEPERIEPYLDLNARTRVAPYEVFLRVEGTADRFRYELTSDPPLSQPDIIALLLTGSPLQPQAAGGSVARPELFTGDLAANYFAGALSDRFTRQLRRALGLERLEVNSLLVEGSADPTTRLTLGKRINEDVRLIYSTDLGTTERRLYRVDWQVFRNLRLSFTRDTTGGVGGELEFERRFGGARSADRARTASPWEVGESPGEGPTPTVAAVEIRGGDGADAGELRALVPYAAGSPLRRTDVYRGARAIREALVRKGRLEARVGTETLASGDEPGAVRVVYHVEPGPRIRVELAGTKGKERRRLLRRLDEFWLEGPHGASPYDDAAELMLEELRGRGFYAAVVDHQVQEAGTERVVRFTLERGRPVRVGRVRIEGATAFPEEDLLARLATRRDEALIRQALDQDAELLRRVYQEAGYLDALVQRPLVNLSLDGEEAAVRFRIVEGGRYELAEVRVQGAEGLAVGGETVAAWSGLEPGGPYAASSVSAAEAAIRSRLDAEGYPDARVESEVSFADGRATVVLRVDHGGRKRIGAIEIVGLRATRPKIVRRQLAFRVGDPLSNDSLLETQRRLYRLGLFRSVRLSYGPMSGGDPSLHAVRVELEEAAPLRVAVGAGYDSEGGARGTVSASHQNLGGYGREVAIQGKASQIERRVQLVAREPRLFNRDLEALLTTFWERREQVGFTERRQATAFRVRKELRPGWARYLRYNFQRVDLSDVVNPEALRDQKLENLRLGDLSVAIVRDTRDDLFLTTRGSYASVETRLFAPDLLSDDSFLKIFAQGSWTRSFGRDKGCSFVSALRIGLARPFGGTGAVPLSERFFAGGDSTLRGFERDGVGPRDVDPVTGASRPSGGEGLLLVNEEFRFPILWRLKGVVFYDAGNVYRNLADADPFDLRHAAGVGLRLETPIGPLRLEYGRKLDREPGESDSELFFAIGSAF